MGTNYIIVREYLESLKEDTELDKLFPLLLSLMGYSIVTTARESKGQPQYGKDIIAVGTDEDGVKKRFYFELKGHADKDITDTVWSKQDGIRDSLIAAKDAPFEDSSIPGFNELPIKYILVHNGTIRTNTRKTFEGFIQKDFPDNNFERWDIYKLTELFGGFLFGEFLLTENENLSLFKKTLVLLDTPNYELVDFKQLVQKLLVNNPAVTSREFEKLFATLQLLCYILFHYSKEASNLTPAKNGIGFCVLSTWHWILKNNLEKEGRVINRFRKLLETHHLALQAYFKKTLPVALLQDGLFSGKGVMFETAGYPLRAMEYLLDLVYFFSQRQYYPKYNGTIPPNKRLHLEKFQKAILFKLIEANDGCRRPLLDNHYMPIAAFALFILKSQSVTDEDKMQVHNYLIEVFDNIMLIHMERKRFPEFLDNVEALLEYMAKGERPFDYEDSSSLLITIIFELYAIVNIDTSYEEVRSFFSGKINLELAFPYIRDGFDFEQAFFGGNIYNEMFAETDIQLPEKLEEFRESIKAKGYVDIHYRTDKAGFPFLRLLSTIIYKNDIFPNEWRSLLSRG